MERINTLATVTIAYFTFVASVGAVATYFSTVKPMSTGILLSIISFYIGVSLYFIDIARRKIK